jgi:cysteine desulfurase/selenocysteine lyase
MTLNSATVKKDFPIFKALPKLVYLDSTATSLKPSSVVTAETEYYTKYSANIFRGIYKISEKATKEYENSRIKIARFVDADPNGVIFVRNTTEAINLIAQSWGNEHINYSDEIITTVMEHHSNFVPWQQLSKQKKAVLKTIGLTPDFMLDTENLYREITPKTKLVALAHISNVLGAINQIKKITAEIKRRNPNCMVIVDGAQAVPHMKVSIKDLGCDFYAFSSHKMLGPTGVGVLCGKVDVLNKMKPYQYGGEMIEAVYPDYSDFKKSPHKFEAGTPHIAGVIALGAAVEYLQKIGMENIRDHEKKIIVYAFKKFKGIPHLKIIGPTDIDSKAGIFAFTIGHVHAHDLAQILDEDDICIRAGHHCAMPLHLNLKIAATARASFYLYTTTQDIDALVLGVKKSIKLLT